MHLGETKGEVFKHLFLFGFDAHVLFRLKSSHFRHLPEVTLAMSEVKLS